MQNNNKNIISVPLTISHDMGWQRRSTSRVYDSISGHGFLVGCRSHQVIHMGVMAKKCGVCSVYNRRRDVVKEHSCTINHDVSSGSMESLLRLQLVESIAEEWNGRVFIKEIVLDDDSKLRAKLQHVENGGLLQASTPEPTFLCDPGHRTKIMVFFLQW